MNILIPTEYGEDFIDAIIAKIIKDINYKLFISNLSILTMWIKIEFNLLHKNIDCESIIKYALKNLTVVKGSNYYRVEINQIINYPKTTIRLITLIKAISYGNRYFKGNKILIDEFQEVNTNIDNLYEQYKLLGELI